MDLIDPREDAKRLRKIAARLSYNNHLQSEPKHAINEIAMRLETGAYLFGITSGLSNGCTATLFSGVNDGPHQVTLYYHSSEQAETAHAVISSLIAEKA